MVLSLQEGNGDTSRVIPGVQGLRAEGFTAGSWGSSLTLLQTSFRV